MSNQAKHFKGKGSALIWILAWLVGVIGIAGTGLNYAVPRFEQKLHLAVQESISSFNVEPLVVSTLGRQVTLTGKVGSEEEKLSLVAAVNSTPGVANVNSQITIVQASSKSSTSGIGDSVRVPTETDTAQSSIQLAQAPSLPTEEDITPKLTQAPEEEVLPPNPEELEVVAADVTNIDANSALQEPSINIKVFGNILSIEGTMATSDDTSSLVKNALDSFNLDVVSNGLTLTSEVKSARWLTSLQGIMPLMGTMSNAQIGVANQQLTLEGLAPTREIHDAIINEALASIGDFSLIEGINVEGESEGSNEPTLILTASAESDSVKQAATDANEQARLAAEAAALAKAQREERLAAEAAAQAVATEKARLAAEATALAKAQRAERLAAEAAAQAAATEQARLAAEAAALAKAQREEQLAAETAAQVVAKEQARRAAEAAAKLAQTTQTGGRVGLEQALQNLPSLRILFDTEGNRLTVESLDILDQIAETIIQYPDSQVIIAGHTDATGDPDKNLQLSLLRATTVRDHLIRHGVSVYNLRAIGLGEAVPLAPNNTPEGRAKNRRIEFTFR